MAATGRQSNSGQHVFIFGVYVPPKTRADTYTSLTECLINEIGLIKLKHSDTIILIGGDTNKRDFASLMSAYSDLEQVSLYLLHENTGHP